VIESGTIGFNEIESGGEALAVVRYDEDRVSLCLSIRSGADLEVVMGKADALRLVAALNKALE
jgi:hypothetical protein